MTRIRKRNTNAAQIISKFLSNSEGKNFNLSFFSNFSNLKIRDYYVRHSPDQIFRTMNIRYIFPIFFRFSVIGKVSLVSPLATTNYKVSYHCGVHDHAGKHTRVYFNGEVARTWCKLKVLINFKSVNFILLELNLNALKL